MSLTQEEFGNKIGLSKSGISNIENGTRGIRERHIKLICSIFNVSESWLKTGVDAGVKVSKLAEDAHRFECFKKYLESIGYDVTVEKTGESSEGHHEEQKDENGEVVGQMWIPDEEYYSVMLIKGNVTTEFTAQQFKEFQSSIEKSVDFEVFKQNN
ncbi:MAG: helix-turn-helix transcriptional regulator [Clostridiaceae bacterium]|nr:helix-turn-helix transcriptional regulator [Clostridiaceae bacterium]